MRASLRLLCRFLLFVCTQCVQDFWVKLKTLIDASLSALQADAPRLGQAFVRCAGWYSWQIITQ